MADFKFVKVPNPSHKDVGFDEWVVLAPKRSKRPSLGKGEKRVCPFCPGNEKKEKEVFRIGGQDHDDKWSVRVIPNKFPFTSFHEVVIHTPYHNKIFSKFAVEEVKSVIETYVYRFNAHRKYGKVCIFCNSGKIAGESIGHSHSQITVVPVGIDIIVPKLEHDPRHNGEFFEVKQFFILCPPFSQWPDEVWIVPKERGKLFGDMGYEQIGELSYILKRLVKIFEIRRGDDFPFNYYIYPYHDWYLRIMPRAKTLGGFEIATGIYVNTQDPRETMKFIKEHFYDDQERRIRKNKAEYRKGV